jgi:phospholipid/cholesterol/gamma-HCH transport system permease protein
VLDFLKPPVEAFQDFIFLGGRAVRNIFRSPHYAGDVFQQMDAIGDGSLPIVIMIGFFSGVVMTMQLAHALQQLG